MRIAVFGYGSLVSQASLARTLGRKTDTTPATLQGWKRNWTAILENSTAKNYYVLNDGNAPESVAVLNIQPSEKSYLNGILVGCTEGDLENLINREIHYDLVDVTKQIDIQDFDKIYSFTAKDRFLGDGTEPAIIPLSYKLLVEEAFRQLGEDQLDLYLETTEVPKYNVIETRFIF